MMLDFDTLLEYFSCIKTGSWNSFKQSINNINYNEIELNHSRIKQMYSRLGHIEFIFDDKSYFCVAKPALAVIPNTNKAVLCGARTRKFLSLLKNACNINNIELTEYPNNNAPAVILLTFNNDAQKRKINDFVPVINNFSKKVLSLLPSLDSYIENLADIDFFQPENYGLQVYNANKKIFTSCNSFSDGLYRMQSFTKDRYFLYLKNAWKEIDRTYGILKALQIASCKNIFLYKNNAFCVNNRVQIPELADRALTMFSGYNPEIENHYRIYSNVSFEAASLLSRKLGQKLECVNEKIAI